MSTHGYWITGTDTGVGKTMLSAALIEVYRMHGKRVVGMKPIAAGCEVRDGELRCDDSESLLRASSIKPDRALVTPYAYEPAVAPHLAAEAARRPIEFAPILAAYYALREQAEVVIVEGVGGFAVPLSPEQDSADLAVAFGLPVILVVGLRLGCLNHALLTQEAIIDRGLTFAGWIANAIDPDMALREENIAALEQRLVAPRLGSVPFLDNPRSCTAAAFVDPPLEA